MRQLSLLFFLVFIFYEVASKTESSGCLNALLKCDRRREVCGIRKEGEGYRLRIFRDQCDLVRFGCSVKPQHVYEESSMHYCEYAFRPSSTDAVTCVELDCSHPDNAVPACGMLPAGQGYRVRLFRNRCHLWEYNCLNQENFNQTDLYICDGLKLQSEYDFTSLNDQNKINDKLGNQLGEGNSKTLETKDLINKAAKSDDLFNERNSKIMNNNEPENTAAKYDANSHDQQNNLTRKLDHIIGGKLDKFVGRNSKIENKELKTKVAFDPYIQRQKNNTTGEIDESPARRQNNDNDNQDNDSNNTNSIQKVFNTQMDDDELYVKSDDEEEDEFDFTNYQNDVNTTTKPETTTENEKFKNLIVVRGSMKDLNRINQTISRFFAATHVFDLPVKELPDDYIDETTRRRLVKVAGPIKVYKPWITIPKNISDDHDHRPTLNSCYHKCPRKCPPTYAPVCGVPGRIAREPSLVFQNHCFMDVAQCKMYWENKSPTALSSSYQESSFVFCLGDVMNHMYSFMPLVKTLQHMGRLPKKSKFHYRLSNLKFFNNLLSIKEPRLMG